MKRGHAGTGKSYKCGGIVPEEKNIVCKNAMKFFAEKFYCRYLRRLLTGAGLAPAQSKQKLDM